ncbi:MAG TPA: HD domain-containing phosphohydrolase [Syntrophales bacterium]|nr:HD domain-containing phosphohydrolase [Syntrophales bacterium]
MIISTAREMYSDTIQYLNYVKERINAKNSFDLEPAVHIIERIVDEPGAIQNIFPLSMKDFQIEDDILPHQTNDMIYTLKIGIGLKYSRSQLIELGLSALLHDLGMFMLPKDILDKPGKLIPSEIDVMRSHVGYGRDILFRFEKEHPFLPEVAYQHHERDNGSGYPKGLKSAEIHEYAKIVCLMDCYEAMTHNRPHRKALNQTFSAKELLIEIKKIGSQSNIVRTFLEEITLYPVGSLVRLNNKSIGEVVATSNSNPLKPDVNILFDHQGNRVRGEQIIRLKESPIVFIEEYISSEGLPEHQLSLAPSEKS